MKKYCANGVMGVNPKRSTHKHTSNRFIIRHHVIGSFLLTFFLLSLILPSTTAEDYPDYEFNQRMGENAKKVSNKAVKNSNKHPPAKNLPERSSYNTITKSPIHDGQDGPDDDIIVTKPISCLESSGRKIPECDYLSEQPGHIIYPVVHIEKRQVPGTEYEEESTSGYNEKNDDDDEDDEDDEEGGDEDDEEEDEETVIDGKFNPERNENYNMKTTERLEGASRPPYLNPNIHNPYGNSHEETKRRMSTISFHIPGSQPPYVGYNNPPNYPRNNIDVSSSYIKDRQYQQLTAKMNILLIAGIAAGIVVLLFILVLAACKFYTSSTGVASAKAMNDYQRSASKTAYAYEACNTGAKCSSPLLVPTSQQALTPLNATSQAGLTNVASSATNTATKPAKKDVKEWYV